MKNDPQLCANFHTPKTFNSFVVSQSSFQLINKQKKKKQVIHYYLYSAVGDKESIVVVFFLLIIVIIHQCVIVYLAKYKIK